MPNNFSPKYLSLLKLIRINAPTGYLLSFFPASFGLMLAYEKTYDLIYLPIFFIGSILVRSAGCIINDLFDQNLDKKVARTQDRPLASGAISNKEALIFLFILLGASLSILLSLSLTSIYIGFVSASLITIYPLMKRITYFPQVFLGLTFNTGCLIAYAALKDSISYDAILLYIACGFWTIGYDTVYAFMDLKDDKKVGIKSSALFFEHMPYKFIISIFYTIFFVGFAAAIEDILSLYTITALSISTIIALWITVYLDIKNMQNCMIRFKANNYIGFLLFLAMLLEKL
ncbi:MAG: 4-hydroxybenzoate octaprenyltransferase [Rickettsiaceae bacterium]|nr:4-hydroxybenzoate octaprenyltransferase [Rickettsiaceae bacterium]